MSFFINKKKTWLIRVVRTGEILEYFRTRWAAKEFKPKWKDIVKEEVEIVYNEEL